MHVPLEVAPAHAQQAKDSSESYHLPPKPAFTMQERMSTTQAATAVRSSTWGQKQWKTNNEAAVLRFFVTVHISACGLA
jgi:hypothetical protein